MNCLHEEEQEHDREEQHQDHEADEDEEEHHHHSTKPQRTNSEQMIGNMDADPRSMSTGV